MATHSSKDLPCDWQNDSISELLFPASRPDVLLGFCDSVYVVDSVTLEVRHRLILRPEDLFRGLAVSPDGRTIAVSTLTEGVGAPYYVYLFGGEDYRPLARWDVDASSLSFSEDGRLLVIERKAGDTPDDMFTRRTGVEVRAVPSGKLISEWWRKSDDGYIHRPQFIPGRPDIVATERNQCSSLAFEFWDASTGRKVGEVVHAHVDEQCWRTHEIFAPDWSWAATTHWDDPDDTSYIQDLVVCDPFTGRVLYETPRRYWTAIDDFAFHTGVLFLASPKGLTLADVSMDGRYLLTLEYDRFVVYEVVGQPEPARPRVENEP